MEDASKASVVEVLWENLKGNPPLFPQSWDRAQKLSFDQRDCTELLKGSWPLGCSNWARERICFGGRIDTRPIFSESRYPTNGPCEDKKYADRAAEARHPLKLWKELQHFITGSVTNESFSDFVALRGRLDNVAVGAGDKTNTTWEISILASFYIFTHPKISNSKITDLLICLDLMSK